MPRPTEETRCENCQWHQPETKLWKSSCKAYPPTLGSGHCGHPTTDPHDWCREFTPMELKEGPPSTTLESIVSRMEPGIDRTWLANWTEELKKAHREAVEEFTSTKTPEVDELGTSKMCIGDHLLQYIEKRRGAIEKQNAKT